MANSGKILVIKPSSLGDIVHLFPALELLKREFPGKELDFVVHPAFAGILDLSPFPVRKKILFDRKRLSAASTFFSASRSLLRELRQEEYDLVIDFQGLFRSGLLTFFARSKVKCGFAAPREKAAVCFYNRKYDVDMTQHAVPRYVELVNRICNTASEVPEYTVALDKELFADWKGTFVVLVPGARWQSKMFPPEVFAQTVLEIRKHFPECQAVIAGAAGDKSIAQQIVQLLPDAVDMTGKTTLTELAHLMARAAAVITNDSGPMHVAAAAGSRVFALFGPTSPGLTGPWGKEHRIITCEKAACLNCMKRHCPAPQKYLCHRIDCEKLGAEIGNFIKSGKEQK